MTLAGIIGQPLAVELARSWYLKGSTHPLLLYGPDGVGKRTLAIALAQALECPSPVHADACGACAVCKKVAAGHHPDVRVVDLAWQAAAREELLAKQQTLRMETVLAERKRLLQSSVEGAWKVLILDDAHRLTPDAANVFLKLLEEPPPLTAIFLLTPYRDRLFTTLVSRCQPVRFKPLSDAEMDRCLSQQAVPQELRARLIELALGSPGRALHLNRDEQLQAMDEAETLWENLFSNKPFAALARPEGRGKARVGRSEMEPKLLALLVPAQRALRQGDRSAAAAIDLIQQTLQRVRQNVQPGLAYDVLVMQLSRRQRH